MGNGLRSCFLLLLASTFLFLPTMARAGDEDVREEKAKVERPKEEPKETLPEVDATESPDPAALKEPETVSAAVAEEKAVPAAPVVAKKPLPKTRPKPQEPDDNINYMPILSSIDPESLPELVRPEALGTRGYRPHMIALAIGDRTPGYGALLEYSFNRIGVGAAFSYRELPAGNPIAKSQTFGNLYATYQCLPFWMTPYFLLGVELASKALSSTGAMAGVGIEAQIYHGWTASLGYTYHSTLRDGFLGGSFGWAF